MSVRLDTYQKEVLKYALIAMLVLGFLLIRRYIGLIVVAAIMSYLSNPIYKRLKKRTARPGLAATLTFAITVIIVIIPIVICVALTILQVRSLVDSIPDLETIDLNQLSDDLIAQMNGIIEPLPGDFLVTHESVWATLTTALTAIGQSLLNFLTTTVASVPAMITSLILYLYVYLNMLLHQEAIVRTIEQLNPLGKGITEQYLNRIGSMTTAMVRGQFIIAFLQGLTGAASLAVIGYSDLFFPAVMILTILSIIPLGGGILLIPLGIGIMIFGDFWSGVFILAVHFLVTTNIDNILRPRLVPKDAQLNSALMMLSVFGGIAIFGFLGIVIGPVLMVLITSTLQLYLQTKQTTPHQLTN